MDPELHSWEVTYRITNIAAKEIIVKVKGGLNYIIKRSAQSTYRTEQLVYVKIANIYLENLKVDETAALTKMDKAILEEVRKEQERLMKEDCSFYACKPQDINVKINLTKGLVERSDAIHSELLGITLYIGSENLDRPCLNTPGYTLQEIYASYDKEADHAGGLHCFIYVNDPDRVSAPLYTNIMGKATEVPIDHDKNKQAGLYVGISRGIETRETQYYPFGSLDDVKLVYLGLFKTKAECDKGGNTERFLTAEAKNKELSKDLSILRTQNETFSEALVKADVNNVRLNNELINSISAHKNELARLKYEHNMEATQLKHQSKMSSELFKFENRVKDTAAKANLEMVKQKGAHNSWGDFAKAVGTLAGVAFTGYSLLTA